MMKNSILVFFLMLPMLSFGQPVQLTVFYKQKTVLHESVRAAIRQKAGVKLSLEIDDPHQCTDTVLVSEEGLRPALKAFKKSHEVEYIQQVTPEFVGETFDEPGYSRSLGTAVLSAIKPSSF